MLRDRVITGLILAAAALAGIYLLPPAWFAGVFCLVIAAVMWEWAGLAGLQARWQRSVYLVLYLLICAALAFNGQWHIELLRADVGLWGVAVVLVLLFPMGALVYRNRVFVTLAGLLAGTGAWVALLVLHARSSHWVVWGLVLCAAADIGAYFAGRAFGRTKLAPRVSPGKTWAGFWGGFVLAVSTSVAGLWMLDHLSGHWIGFVVVLAVLSVFGDLFESLLKRAGDIKDSGSLLPGHGGLLDRVDSALAVFPLLALLLIYGL